MDRQLHAALTDVAATLRHHRDLGVTDVTLAADASRPPARVSPAAPVVQADAARPAPSDDTLVAQQRALQGCRLCKLCEARSTIVFGSGNPNADLVVIGEGPGADEDAQGVPFVGRAGQLLTKMLASVNLTRDEVYIANAVKCFISPRVMIYTADGYRPIKDLRIGDLVLTHRGRFRPVSYVRPRESLPGNSQVVRIAVTPAERYGKPTHLTVTPEHPFLVNGGQWKPACELKPGDAIATLGDSCEVCGRTYFVRYDRYERRTYRTCGERCHNQRVFHSDEARQKISRTMREQYLDGRRDASTIALRANQKTRELVAAGLAKLQSLTPGERHRGRVKLAENITAGLRRGQVGFGEFELELILQQLDVAYIHLFAVAGSSWLFDFCIPEHKILIEVRGSAFNAESMERALLKDALAKSHGYLVLNLWAFQILNQPDSVTELLRRLLKNHRGEFTFVDAVVSAVAIRRTSRDFPLYNIGVEEDESYVAAGVVSHNCRPPGNRNPEGDELAACRPFLDAQLAAIQPKVVLTLGSVATQALLRTKEPIGKLRGRLHPFGDAVLVPTFHPAYLLRNPGQEYRRMAWDDLKLAKREYDARRTQ